MSASSEPKVTMQGYVIGFGLSLVMTLIAYTLVVMHKLTNTVLFGVVVTLALIQFVVQVIYFLHLGADRKPKWKSMAFLFMLLVVGIIVIGSLWIMSNLNYHMSPQQINTYLNNQSSL